MANLNVELKEEIMRLIKAKSALKGISIPGYIEQLVISDNKNLKNEVRK